MQSSAAGPPRDNRRNAIIDRFRGLAILLVVLYHINGVVVFPDGWGIVRGADGTAHLTGGPSLLRFLLLPIHFGRMGVNLFFVLSGLCIHLRMAAAMARDPSAPFSPRAYLLRRFFRIYPAYWAALGLGVLLQPPLDALLASFDGHPFWQVLRFPSWGSIAAHLVMLHTFSKAYIMDILPPLWSIATEEQFYLLYPLVFVYLGRRVPVRRIVLGLLLLTACWRLALVLGNPPPRTFADGPFLVWLLGFSLSRYYEWGLGALLAWGLAGGRARADLLPGPWGWLAASRRRLVAAGLAFISMGAGSLINARVKWLIEDPCYSTGWFLIMAAALLPGGGALRAPPWAAGAWAWLDQRLQRLGQRSFSVYLLHELVIFQVVWLVNHFHLPRLLLGAPLAYAATIALCYSFYHLVERPFEARSKAIR